VVPRQNLSDSRRPLPNLPPLRRHLLRRNLLVQPHHPEPQPRLRRRHRPPPRGQHPRLGLWKSPRRHRLHPKPHVPGRRLRHLRKARRVELHNSQNPRRLRALLRPRVPHQPRLRLLRRPGTSDRAGPDAPPRRGRRHPRPLPAQHHQPRPRQQRLPHRLRRQRRQARPLRPASPRRKAHRPPA
jgi:hypothetical protein